MQLQIEGRVLGDLADNHVMFRAIRYQNIFIENVKGLKEIYGDKFKKFAQEQLDLIETISEHIAAAKKGCNSLLTERKQANKIEDTRARALAYHQNIKPLFGRD